MVKDASGEAELATKRDIDDLRRDMGTGFIQLEQRMVIKLGSPMVVAVGVVAVLVRLL